MAVLKFFLDILLKILTKIWLYYVIFSWVVIFFIFCSIFIVISISLFILWYCYVFHPFIFLWKFYYTKKPTLTKTINKKFGEHTCINLYITINVILSLFFLGDILHDLLKYYNIYTYLGEIIKYSLFLDCELTRIYWNTTFCERFDLLKNFIIEKIKSFFIP